MRFKIENDKVYDTYREREMSSADICSNLNTFYIESMRTRRDVEHSIELKAVNRMLRMENRFLTIKLQQLAWRGMLDISEIEKEISELCLNPNEASDYIHKFEKENAELKQKLKMLGEYTGDIL